MIECLVLLGPPGSGKSHLAALLVQRLGLDWIEHEAVLLARWGSRAAFLANKAEALAALEQDLLSRVGARRRTVVFESTGLSDRPMLERLALEHRVAIVKLHAPRELCETRVSHRERGRHFDDDPSNAARFHDLWTTQVAPGWHADLDVLNDVQPDDPAADRRTDSIVESIAHLLARG
jgi:shikimate kinase